MDDSAPPKDAVLKKLIALRPGPDCITCANAITALNTSISVSWIDPKHLHSPDSLLQVPKRLMHLPVVAPENVDKAHIFPTLPPSRTLLDLGNVKVSQRTHAHRPTHRAGHGLA